MVFGLEELTLYFDLDQSVQLVHACRFRRCTLQACLLRSRTLLHRKKLSDDFAEFRAGIEHAGWKQKSFLILREEHPALLLSSYNYGLCT